MALLDAYDGSLLHTLTGHKNDNNIPLEACFSPDGAFVVGGSEDGTIWRWETGTGAAKPPLRGHEAPVTAVKCNPTRMMLASSCSAVCMWLPTPK